MKKPTLHDVARTAGVSYATADRVLNARGGVAAKSALRVQQAIEDLGYERDLHAANLSRRRTYRFVFVLPAGDHSFFNVLRAAVQAEIDPRKADRIQILVRDVPMLDPDALAEMLESIPAGDCDCVTVVASETPRVDQAVAGLVARGIPVVTLIGDAAPDSRAAYVGIDNVMAGRTAGRLIRMAHGGRRGCILPILGALTARDHRDRLEGAHAVLTEPGADFDLLPAIAVQDRGDRMHAELTRVMSQVPDITGIYSIGAGNRALVGILSGMTAPRPFTLMHELTPVTRDALRRGLIDAVIDQNPAQEVAAALNVMKALADGRDLPGQLINPTIYIKDNIP